MQAGPWGIVALQETHHAGQAEGTTWCSDGTGPNRPLGRPIIFGFRHISKPRVGYTRLLPSCHAYIRLLLTPMADLLLLKATFVSAKSHLCMLPLRGRSVLLSSNTASCQPASRHPPSFGGGGSGLELRGWGSRPGWGTARHLPVRFFPFFDFYFGSRGNVHPPRGKHRQRNRTHLICAGTTVLA